MQERGSLAERYRVSSATVIRWALRALSNHVEGHDDRMILPLELNDQAVPKAAKTAKKRGH